MSTIGVLLAIAVVLWSANTDGERTPASHACCTSTQPQEQGAKASQVRVQSQIPALTLAPDLDINSALDSLISAIESDDINAALRLAKAIRSGGLAVSGSLRSKLLTGSTINLDALASRARITALCLAATDTTLVALLETVLRDWSKEGITPENAKSWNTLERRPLEFIAAEALSPNHKTVLNGLMSGLMWRLVSSDDFESLNTWASIWKSVSLDTGTVDPIVSLIIWYPAQKFKAADLPTNWRAIFEQVRNSPKYSLRLRVQAGVAFAPVSESLMEVLKHLAQALGREEAAKVLAQYLAQSPTLTAEDWHLLMASLVNGRTYGDASAIIRNALMSCATAICESGRIADYGDSLAEVFLCMDGDKTVLSLSGNALYDLVVARQVARGKSRTTRTRQPIFNRANDEQTLARLLALFEKPPFVVPDKDPKQVEQRIDCRRKAIRIAFELRLEVGRLLSALDVFMASCTTTREKMMAIPEAIGAIAGLGDSKWIEGGPRLLSRLIALSSEIVTDNDNGSLWATLSSCTNALKCTCNIATSLQFPPLDDGQLQVLSNLNKLAKDTALELTKDASLDSKKRVNQYLAEVNQAWSALSTQYKTNRIDDDPTKKGEIK